MPRKIGLTSSITPARAFEAFVADTSAANSKAAVDIHVVFESHGFELV